MKLTQNKLIFFERILQAIEERATFVTAYLAKVKTTSLSYENFSSMQVGGQTSVYRCIRGENNYLSFPTELLYSDEALARYRTEKDESEQRRVLQQKEADKQAELRLLNKLLTKHPQFLEGEKNTGA